MSDLNKIINEQRERIAELESDKEALDRENSSLANLVKNSVKRTATAESDRNGYIMLIAVLANADNFNEFIKNITVDKASELINKFAIEQQIKSLEKFKKEFPVAIRKMWSAGEIQTMTDESLSQLRQQLNGGE